MTPLQIKAKLSSEKFCPVLSKHIINLFDVFEDYPQEQSSIIGVDFILKRFVNTPHVGYFSNDQKRLSTLFKISAEQENPIFEALDTVAKFYVMYAIMPLTVTYSNEDLEHLRKIEKAAERLQSLLPEKNSSLYMIMTMAEQIETYGDLHFDEKINAVPVFFDNLDETLSKLIAVRLKIPQTKLGQFLKLGVKSQKGNLGLKIWVDQLYRIWFGYMERSFDYDGRNGTSGRKRFTEFAYETLVVIHPLLTYGTIENSVRSYYDQYHKNSEGLPPLKIT